MTQPDGLTEKLVALMIDSFPVEKDALEAMLSLRSGRIHVAGHLVMAQILGVSADVWLPTWPHSCTTRKSFSISRTVDAAPIGTAERTQVEAYVLICLAGIGAESIDAAEHIDQPRARSERAAALAHLMSVESEEKVAHYWMAYLVELVRHELKNSWQEVGRVESRLAALVQSNLPEKNATRRMRGVRLRELVHGRAAPGQPMTGTRESEGRAPADPADLDPSRQNAASIDDGVLDSRLEALGLPKRQAKCLNFAGLSTVRDLISLRLSEIEQIRGVSLRGARTIEKMLNAAGYLHMPGDYPERWRRFDLGKKEETLAACKTDLSSPIEGVLADQRMVGLMHRANIYCIRDLVARGEFDLITYKSGITGKRLDAIAEAMREAGYILAGRQPHRRWQREHGHDSARSEPLPRLFAADPLGPLELIPLPIHVFDRFRRADFFTIGDILRGGEQTLYHLGLDDKAISAVTSAMFLNGYVLLGEPGKRLWMNVKQRAAQTT